MPHIYGYTQKAKVGIRPSETRVISECEPPDVGTGNQTWFFWKSIPGS